MHKAGMHKAGMHKAGMHKAGMQLALSLGNALLRLDHDQWIEFLDTA